jgi:hypothetical protein
MSRFFGETESLLESEVGSFCIWNRSDWVELMAPESCETDRRSETERKLKHRPKELSKWIQTRVNDDSTLPHSPRARNQSLLTLGVPITGSES